MTKLYYDNPLEAALMAESFGVKLQHRHTDEQLQEYDLKEHERFFDWKDTFVCADCDMLSDLLAELQEASGYIYIHPDSYHIFEPQIKDIIRYSEGAPIAVEKVCGAVLDSFDMITGWKIIQRNNKAFIMPKEEK